MTAASKKSYKRLTSGLIASGALLACSSMKLVKIIIFFLIKDIHTHKHSNSKLLVMVPKGKQQMNTNYSIKSMKI